MTNYQTNDTPLRAALMFNGFFSSALGIACLFAAAPLASLLFRQEFSILGLSASSVLFELGIGLLVFAALVLFTARQAMINRGRAKLITALDIVWVAATVIMLATVSDYFSGYGTTTVIAIMIVVLFFAIMQAFGLAMLYQGKNDIVSTRQKNTMTLTASTFTRADPERVWQVISDQEAYAEVADNISRVEIVSGQGQEMVRKCTDNDGRSWNETCTMWDEGRAFAFRVHTEAEDYPYPIAKLFAEWSLIPGSDLTRIRMVFRVTAKPGLLNRLIFIVMAAPFGATCDRLLDNWVARIEGRAASTSSTNPASAKPADPTVPDPRPPFAQTSFRAESSCKLSDSPEHQSNARRATPPKPDCVRTP